MKNLFRLRFLFFCSGLGPEMMSGYITLFLFIGSSVSVIEAKSGSTTPVCQMRHFMAVHKD